MLVLTGKVPAILPQFFPPGLTPKRIKSMPVREGIAACLPGFHAPERGKSKSLESQRHKHVGIASPYPMILSASVEPMGERSESPVGTLDARAGVLSSSLLLAKSHPEECARRSSPRTRHLLCK